MCVSYGIEKGDLPEKGTFKTSYGTIKEKIVQIFLMYILGIRRSREQSNSQKLGQDKEKEAH